MYFRNYALPKTRLDKSNKCRFPLPFEKQHGKGDQTLFRSARQHLYHIYGSLETRLSLKKSLLVICKILRLFLNKFTADDKYSLLNRENLTQPIQMQLSEKLKTFSPFFGAVFKSRLNIQHFQKKR